MKAHQRAIFNRLKKALADGRKQGYKPTMRKIYYQQRVTSFNKKEQKWESQRTDYACAYGAMCVGLGVDVESLGDSFTTFTATAPKVAKALGVEVECINLIYEPIWRGNDGINDKRVIGDQAALDSLETFLNNNPEVC